MVVYIIIITFKLINCMKGTYKSLIGYNFFFLLIIVFSLIVQAESKVSQDVIIRYPNTTEIVPSAKQVIIIDFLSGKVLLEKNAYARMTPSSMTKIMTSYLLEEKIQKKELAFDTEFIVSEKAWRMGGSKSFMPLGKMVSVKDILYAIIIQSGNDASIVAAEGMYGSEENFVDKMNQKAQEMGMKDTHFMNATGWPEKNHYSTAYDVALLAKFLIKDHPEFYPIYKEKYFTFGKDQKGRPITQGNRNPLLYKDLGCDGVKTGHTEDGGFGIAASFLDNGRRYLIVVNGLSSMQERAQESLMLLNWIKQNFTTKKFYNRGEEVWGGRSTIKG